MTELLVRLHAAHSSRSLRCSSCGYGVSVRVAPAACPMCRGTDWHEDTRSRAGALLGGLPSPAGTRGVGPSDRV